MRVVQGFKNKWRILGTLKALEITYGENGWHPHLHVLVVSDSLFTPRVELEVLAMASGRRPHRSICWRLMASGDTPCARMTIWPLALVASSYRLH
jgi:hypothetical protein